LIGALALSDLLTVSCATPTEISSVIHDLNIWVIPIAHTFQFVECHLFFLFFLIQKLPYEFRNQDFGQLGCVSFPFLQSAAILSNALILCLIAYDRYVCVVKMHPNAIKQKPGWPIIGSIITVWIVSIGMEIIF
jgi:hypothetical protein